MVTSDDDGVTVRRFDVSANDHGEWSVSDPIRRYRLCAYNHGPHGGVHVHHRGVTSPVEDVPSKSVALRIVTSYPYETFELDAFKEHVRTWRSSSHEG